MRLLLFLAVLLVATVTTAAFGLGADYPTDQPVGGSAKWPKGLKELVNMPQRVHGYFVNDEDVFFFAGDVDQLNAFLKSYSQLPNTRLQVVLHPGHPEVKSPWNKQPLKIDANWKLYATPYRRKQLKDGKVVVESGRPFTTELDIWTGGQADILLTLEVASKVPVEAGVDAKDDTAIERFVVEHRK